MADRGSNLSLLLGISTISAPSALGGLVLRKKTITTLYRRMIMRKLLIMLLVVPFAAHPASATLPRQIPESSHYQGFTFYDEEVDDGSGGTIQMRGRIDFAVYDTETYSDEFIGADGFERPGDGRYIYVHQIFNDYDGYSEAPVVYFAVLGLDSHFLDDFGSQEGPVSGVEPTRAYFTGSEMVWEFYGDWIDVGEHSQFLAFSSNMDWCRGEYDMRGPASIPEPKHVEIDIKPRSCPNPLNVKSKGILPVAILGSDIFDANTIVPTSVRLAGVEPIRDSLEDVATPLADPNECECSTVNPDGFMDLTLKFKTQQIIEALGQVNTGDILTLPLTGVLNDETPIEGADCVVIVGRHKPINKADINKDGLVNTVDIAIVAENWLQSSIVED